MFVFDLFEKKKSDSPTSRFVGGTSQDARVKNALDNAYRAVPAAKSPEGKVVKCKSWSGALIYKIA